ncbi:MAG: hypothetical protein RIQ89_1864 [Bacteroidota bacterium]|jgi:uncharacterized protein
MFNFRFLIILLVLLGIDIYAFQGIKFLVQDRSAATQKIIHYSYWALTCISIGTLIVAAFIDWHTWPKALRTYLFAMIVIVYFSKLLLSTFLLIDDVVRLLRWGVSKVGSGQSTGGQSIGRLGFLVKLGGLVSAVPLVSMTWGMIKGAYSYKVKQVILRFDHLPEAFNGFKFVQLSDIHSGSFMSDEHLNEAFDLVLAAQPDAIFFTGDLVNDLHTEAVPFTETFKRLKAPHGVFSVLGNHDYADYYYRTAAQLPEKEENLRRLKALQKSFGWKLLLNEHHYFEKDGARIGLVGVENWSARANFSKYGNLQQAMKGINTDFNILLSHDPSHWEAEVQRYFSNVALTLSGHTHGFQFGIEIPGFKWSPVQYVYKQWAGLYEKNQQYLYVNRGLGFIGYPGRVGIMPEITVVTLQKA